MAISFFVLGGKSPSRGIAQEKGSQSSQQEEEVVGEFRGFLGKEIPGIPSYPGSSRLFYLETADRKKETRAVSVFYHSDEEAPKVVAFYTSEMKKAGWKSQATKTQDLGVTQNYEMTFSRGGVVSLIEILGRPRTQTTIVQINLYGDYRPPPSPKILSSPLEFASALPLIMKILLASALGFLVLLLLSSQFLKKIAFYREGLMYTFLSGLYGSIYFVVSQVARLIHEYQYLLSAILFLIILVAFFRLSKRMVGNLVDRFFFKREYEYRKLLQQSSQKLSSLLSLKELTANILKPIKDNIRLRSVSLLCYDPQLKSFTLLASSGLPKAIAPKSVFVKEENAHRWVLSNKEGDGVVWEAKDRRDFVRNKIFPTAMMVKESSNLEEKVSEKKGRERKEHRELLTSVPLVSKGNLVGLLNLGQKLSKERFSLDDLNLMATIAPQVAIALENARLYQETLDKQRALNHLMQQIREAQEKERRRISRDLHDGIAQNLSGMILNLDSLKRQIVSHPSQAQDQVKELEQLIKDTISDLRSLIYDLRPTALDKLGLNPTLEKYVEHFAQEHSIKLNLVNSLEERLPLKLETAIFRIIQEALSNVKKHAQAKEVNISLEKDEEKIELFISDNGKGFDPESIRYRAEEDRGFGLVGMKERVASLEGNFSLQSKPREGTKIKVRLPIPVKAEVL